MLSKLETWDAEVPAGPSSRSSPTPRRRARGTRHAWRTLIPCPVRDLYHREEPFGGSSDLPPL
jgi:hypothetical protein